MTKTYNLISHLQTLLNNGLWRSHSKIEALEKVMLKLEKKEAYFRERLAETETATEQGKLQMKIAVCRAQRNKGKKVLAELNSRFQIF